MVGRCGEPGLCDEDVGMPTIRRLCRRVDHASTGRAGKSTEQGPRVPEVIIESGLLELVWYGLVRNLESTSMGMYMYRGGLWGLGGTHGFGDV